MRRCTLTDVLGVVVLRPAGEGVLEEGARRDEVILLVGHEGELIWGGVESGVQ